MKRFKDSNNNLYKVSTAALPPVKDWFKPLNPAKLKTPEVGPTGAYLLDPHAIERLESAIKAARKQKGLDEDIAFGVTAISGGSGLAWSVIQSLAQASQDWRTIAVPIGIATVIAGAWIKAKPLARAALIKKWPHAQDTLKTVLSKQYSVLEEVVGSGAAAKSKSYTLPQILEQWNSAGAIDNGEWLTGKIKRRFEDPNQVSKLNQMFKHQYWSDFRDAAMSAGVIPASLGITNLGYELVGNYLTSQFENSPNKAKAQDVAEETSEAPKINQQPAFENLTQIDGILYRYDKNNYKEKNGVIYYYVPAKKGYFKRQLPKGVKE